MTTQAFNTTHSYISSTDEPMVNHREQSGVCFLAQGPFSNQTIGAGDQTDNLSIRELPPLPPMPKIKSNLINTFYW